MKEKLKNKDVLLGTWLTIPSQTIAEIACRAGFDWLAVDLEHSAISIDQALELIRTIDLMGKVPLVRLSNNDEVLIKRIMDSGAHGIIVPMVNSLDDATYAFKSMHYPPLGKRGVGLARAQGYGTNFHGHWQWLKEKSMLFIQIEHKDALNNLDAIFSSGLIDGYLIGPYDLTSSLGIPGEFTHPLYIDALEKIEKYAEKYSIPKGIHIVELDQNKLMANIHAGYQLIAYGVDFRILESNFSSSVNIFKNLKSEHKL